MGPIQQSDRQQRAEALIVQNLERRREGGGLSDEELMAAHPHLNEELRAGLSGAKALSHAFRIAEGDTSVVHDTSAVQGAVQGAAQTANARFECPVCRATIVAQSDSTICDSCGQAVRVQHDWQVDSADLIAHYELIDPLGRGGFGTVWRALDTKLNREVALKVVPRLFDKSAGTTSALAREAQAAAKLQHPNIVSTFDVGVSDATEYIATELIEGGTLRQRLDDRSVGMDDAARFCATIAGAVHHAHEEGIVHRDLKPQNVLLDVDQVPHVADFGLARHEMNEVTITMDGQIVGTPAYMSPEQARGESHLVDRRSDIYSIGVMLYEMLTGELPFRGTLPALVQQIIHVDPPQVRALQPKIDRDLETICMKCLEKQPDQRYSTAGALEEDLTRYLARQPISARPVGLVGRIGRWCLRAPAVASLMALLAMAIVLGGVGVIWKWRVAERALIRATNAEAQSRQNLDVAEQAVEDFLMTVSEDVLLEEPHMEGLRTRLLGLGQRYYQQLADSNARDDDSLARAAYAQVCLANLRARQGADSDEMLRQIENAISTVEALLESSPETNELRLKLWDMYVQYGDVLGLRVGIDGPSNESLLAYEAAVAHLTAADLTHLPDKKRMWWEALSQSLLAIGHGRANDDHARPALLDAIDGYESFLERFPADVEALGALARRHLDLAVIHRDAAEFDAAGKQFQRAEDVMNRAIGIDPRPSLRGSMANILKLKVAALERSGEFQGGMDAIRKAVRVRRKLVADFPQSSRLKLQLLDDLHILANRQFEQNHGESLKTYDEMANLCKKLRREFPSEHAWRLYACKAAFGRASALCFLSDPKAEAELEAACAEAEAIVSDGLDFDDGQRQAMIHAQCLLIRLHSERMDLSQVRHCFDRGIRILSEFSDNDALKELIVLRMYYANSYVHHDSKIVEQQSMFALEELERFAKTQEAESTWTKFNQVQLNYLLGKALVGQQKFAEAASPLREGLMVSGELLAAEPAIAQVHGLLLKYLAEIELRHGNLDGALEFADTALRELPAPYDDFNAANILDHLLAIAESDETLNTEIEPKVQALAERAESHFFAALDGGYDITTKAHKPNYFRFLIKFSPKVAIAIEKAKKY